MPTNKSQGQILIVDDEEDILYSVSLAMEFAGFENVITCSDSREVLSIVEENNCAVVVLDISMPYIDGLTIQRQLAEHYPDVTVIMLTSVNEPDTIVSGMKRGTFDYIVKPIDETQLVTSIKKAVEHYALQKEHERIVDLISNVQIIKTKAFNHIITSSLRMRTILSYIEAIKISRMPMLIIGETGVGKELFAKAVHKSSGVPGKFVAVNCGGIDDTMFSDTLFGHEKGAFSGAELNRKGLIEGAKEGTIFLDEIGDLYPQSQIKLLRLLQDNTYYSLGSDEEKACTARIVAATNHDLTVESNRGAFRKDLYYRFKTHQITIPPLRERLEDIPALVHHFVKRAAKNLGKPIPIVPPEMMVYLQNYSYPGNVRELEGFIYDAVSRQQHAGVLSCETFKETMKKQTNISKNSAQSYTGSPVTVFPSPLPTINEIESQLAHEALKRANGNISLAANLMGVSRNTFKKKLPDKAPGQK